MRAQILDAMRLNRQAFQEDAVLKRYNESSHPRDLAAFVTCDLPRNASGAPAAQYVPAEARRTPRVYPEAKVAECLSTTGGLAGTRAAPLAQHYCCSLHIAYKHCRIKQYFKIDLGALAGTAAILLAAVFVASLIPARSAARVNPLVVLREE
jgi:hypothetical protein